MNLHYFFALITSTCICAVIAITAWHRRAAPGAFGLMLAMMAEMVWSGTYAVRWLVSDVTTQLFWLDATYFGVAFQTTFFLVFALQFTGYSHLLIRRNLVLLSIEPLLTLLVLWTDRWHGLFYGGLRTTGTILAGGAWFWMNVVYSYLFVFIVIGLFTRAYLRSSNLYRLQTGIILFASLLPVVGNFLSLTGLVAIPNLDLTPITFTISGLFYAIGLFGFGLMDVVPVARNLLVEEMVDGVIVLDVQNRIVDINPAAQRLLDISPAVIGKPAGDPLVERLHIDQARTHSLASITEMRLSQNPPLDIELRITPMLDKYQKLTGRLLIVHDITDRKRAEAALRESQAFLADLIENSGVTVFVKDIEGHYTLVNRKWELWNGIKREFAIGRTDVDLFPEDTAKEFRNNDRRVMEQANILEEEDEINDDHGKRSYLTVKFPLRDKDNLINGVCGITTDITDRKRAEMQLREAHDLLEQRVQERTFELQTANVELEKAARMKDEFMASISHELRTPLTGVLGLSEVLQSGTYGQLNEKQMTALGHINSSGKHLLELINDILDYSRIEAGMAELSISPCSLADICQACLQMTAAQADTKHLHGSLSVKPEMVIMADERRLKQILVNLLGNAIKFTEDGGSFGIDVTGPQDGSIGMEGTAGWLNITVWDTGIGIGEEDQARVFQPFVQVDARLSRRYSGTGLGLALVRRLVELHGGGITLQSVPGQGSRFTVKLPWSG